MPSSEHQPSSPTDSCLSLKAEHGELEALFKGEFSSAFAKAVESGKPEDFAKVQLLRAKLEEMADALRKKIDPYNIALRRKLAEEYKYDYVSSFSGEGLARVQQGIQYFFIDKNGRRIFG